MNKEIIPSELTWGEAGCLSATQEIDNRSPIKPEVLTEHKRTLLQQRLKFLIALTEVSKWVRNKRTLRQFWAQFEEVRRVHNHP